MSDAERARPSQPHADSSEPALVIGLGASAGGITALKTFFSNARPDSGAAFVVILHLSPEYESHLAEVLQSATSMPVTQVNGRVRLQPDHVYVIPPNGNLSMDEGDVVVTDVTGLPQRRSPVDVFFRALADSHESRAVAVVLSGTGPNGSHGIKRIKERGGLTIVQDPDEAEYGDMPRNSLASGADYVLAVAAIPAAIVDYDERRRSGHIAAAPVAQLDALGISLHQIVSLLRSRTGHDFANYKPATVIRRIERRMAVRKRATIAEYASFLRETPDETTMLMKDLLISVTSFFRDPTSYAALQTRVVPRLFQGKHSDDHVRAWIAGCASGEEAYSIAMLLAEYAAEQTDVPRIQLFATDLDAQALAVAREGQYSEAEVGDVSEERLRRFFVQSGTGYRIGRELRELVLFAHHNVIRDPPFSHLDLIACRNLLIYLNRTAQERAIETFHFALRPSAFLFLGGSETAEAAAELFLPFDKNAHIYEARGGTSRPALRMGDVALPEVKGAAPRPAELRSSERILPAELHQRLLDSYGAPSVVVTEDFMVVHVSEGAARYLEVPPGEPSRDLRRLAIPELKVDLLTALHQAARERAPVDVQGVRLAAERGGGVVRLVIRPALRDGDPPRGYFLVLFEHDGAAAAAAATAPMQLTSPTDPPITQLEEELARVRALLRVTIEQYESQVEEAKASNEELQALNEELRSSAEELETSKEELQSLNEELSTVNQELKIKIDELGSTNNDFQNFINATDVGAIFLDRLGQIKLFTARARDVFNLLPGDIGRKLSDITSALIYPRLHADITVVLERLQTVEAEVDTTSGRSYLMRVLPYRTSDDHIDGIVLSFVDITSRRTTERSLKTSDERLRLLIESAVDYAIFTMTPDGVVDSWNAGAERMFGYRVDAIVGRSAEVLFTIADRASGVFNQELHRALREGRSADERHQLRLDGTEFYCDSVMIRLGAGGELGFAKIARDLTVQRDAESALENAHAGLERRVGERTLELQEEVVRRSSAQEHVTSLLRKVVTAQEEQRARIARDLHDQFGQQLTALRLALDRHRDRSAVDGVADPDLTRAAALAKDIDAELDFLAWELRPAVLDDLGLVAALPRFLREWSEHHQIAAEFRTTGVQPGQLSREAELTFYRVTQEALNNVVKHAHASRVDVILEGRDGGITLLIEDDGVGFDAADPETGAHGIGIAGMRERASLCGAALELESGVGEGTTVFLRMPAPQGEGDAAG